MWHYVWIMRLSLLWHNMQPITPGTWGRTPSLFYKRTWFFYVRYTTYWTNGFQPIQKTKHHGQVSFLKTQVSWLWLEPTLYWSETPELESSALNRSATLLQKHLASLIFSKIEGNWSEIDWPRSQISCISAEIKQLGLTTCRDFPHQCNYLENLNLRASTSVITAEHRLLHPGCTLLLAHWGGKQINPLQIWFVLKALDIFGCSQRPAGLYASFMKGQEHQCI